MSYILDALKKAEHDRQQEELPHFQANYPATRISTSRKTGYLIWLSAGVILFGLIGFGAYGLVHFKVLSFTAGNETERLLSTTDSVEPRITIEHSTSENFGENNFLKEDAQHSLAGSNEFETNTPTKAVSGVDMNVAETYVPYRKELPEGLRSVLPILRYNGHAYSVNPEKRLIVINNRILREKEIIQTDLMLIEITEDGVVLRYKETVFKDSAGLSQ